MLRIAVVLLSLPIALPAPAQTLTVEPASLDPHFRMVTPDEAVPLFHAGMIWALRDGLTHAPRNDGYTLSQEILPAP